MDDTFILNEYEILSTGADGGHSYLLADIEFKNQSRRIVIFFETKEDENCLVKNAIISVRGDLIDQGIQQSLILNNAVINYVKPIENRGNKKI